MEGWEEGESGHPPQEIHHIVASCWEGNLDEDYLLPLTPDTAAGVYIINRTSPSLFWFGITTLFPSEKI